MSEEALSSRAGCLRGMVAITCPSVVMTTLRNPVAVWPEGGRIYFGSAPEDSALGGSVCPVDQPVSKKTSLSVKLPQPAEHLHSFL